MCETKKIILQELKQFCEIHIEIYNPSVVSLIICDFCYENISQTIDMSKYARIVFI